MKIPAILSLAAFAVMAAPSSQAALIITGIIDGGLTGGTPKAIELYATTDIPDLSVYTIDNANNGGAFDGTTIALLGSASAGDFIYVASESPQFTSYFGFSPGYTGSSLNVNGDDVVGLFLSGVLSDVYGVLAEDGTGMDWEYLDAWAYRANGTGPSSTFSITDWTVSALDVTDGTSTAAETGFPTGTFVPEPSATLLSALGFLGLMRRRR